MSRQMLMALHNKPQNFHPDAWGTTKECDGEVAASREFEVESEGEHA